MTIEEFDMRANVFSDPSVFDSPEPYPGYLSQVAAYDLGLSHGRSGSPSLSYMRSGLSAMYLRGYRFGGCLRHAKNTGLWDAYALLASLEPMWKTPLPKVPP